MSFDKMRHAMASMGAVAAAGMAAPRFGTVTSYDKDTHTVKAMLQPEEVETGWLPIMVLMAGQGWGVYAAPAQGDQALLIFAEGDALVGVCVGFIPNDEDIPPAVPAGEIWLQHEEGSFLKLTSDGKIVSKGPWEHDGDFTATGQITDNSPGNEVTVQDLRIAYNAHHHAETGSTTGPTDTPAE